MKNLILAFALSLFALPALAANCTTYPFTLTNGQTADANQVMANFNLIRNCANSSLAANGANGDITSLTGLTTPLSQAQGGTGSAALFMDNTGALQSSVHIVSGQSTALSTGTSITISGAALFTSYSTVACSVTDTAGNVSATSSYIILSSPQRLRLYNSNSDAVAYICVGN